MRELLLHGKQPEFTQQKDFSDFIDAPGWFQCSLPESDRKFHVTAVDPSFSLSSPEVAMVATVYRNRPYQQQTLVPTVEDLLPLATLSSNQVALEVHFCDFEVWVTTTPPTEEFKKKMLDFLVDGFEAVLGRYPFFFQKDFQENRTEWIGKFVQLKMCV